MKNRILQFVILLLLTTHLKSHAQEVEVDYTNEVIASMMEYYSLGIDEKLYLQLDKPYYSSGERIWIKGYLRNAITHASLPHSNFIYVELIAKGDRLVNRVKIKRDSTGFNGYMILDAEMSPGDYTLRGYTRWMTNKDEEYFFSRSLSIISPIPPEHQGAAQDSTRRERRQAREALTKQAASTMGDFAVQFFPEGGALLSDGTQIVAFKALGEDGFSTEVEGEIFASDGSNVAHIATSYRGMGIVALQVEPGEAYYAVVTSIDGLERRFSLPPVESEGAVINARKSGDRYIFQSRTSDPALLEGAHYIIHSHGRIISVNSAGATTSVIHAEQLFDGINSISLISAQGKMLSERLIFKRPEVNPTIEISTNRSNYDARERVEVAMNIANSFGEVAGGEFGISVTDDSSVEADEQQDHILSYLLLSSDLRGYIEAPALYFAGDLAQADRHLDLLMRTQGWRRFDLEQILASQLSPATLSYEGGGEISGNVKGFFGNEARRPKLDVVCTSLNYYDTFTLDASSHFKLVGLNIPDSTTYMIQTRGRRGGNSLTLNINPEPFAAPRSTLTPRTIEEYIPAAFINQSQEKFYYDGGMNLINLDAVYVTASRSQSEGSNFATHSTGPEQLEMMSGLPLTSVFQQYPSMSISDEGVTYRGSSSMARFIIDGIYMDYEEISYLTTTDVERVEFFSGVEAMMYSDASGGIFVITLKTGASLSSMATTPAGIAMVEQLGYQKSATFYCPSYDTPELKRNLPPDYRTTIYWNSTLTPSSDGTIEFDFYTADKATTYTITVEGIDEDGEIYQATSTINRTAAH
ncbi:MAG: hypothetical protein SNI45_06120 [Rikenellaceae bacterium]